MRTHGTNTENLSDEHLRSYIASAALDVYEAILQGYSAFDISFAQGTLARLTDELLHRDRQAV